MVANATSPWARLRLFEPPSLAPCWGRTALFFSERSEEQEDARRICTGCPRRQDCLLAAVETQQPAGVWGGVAFPDEMRELARLALKAAGRPEDMPDWLAPDESPDEGPTEPEQLPTLRQAARIRELERRLEELDDEGATG